MSVAVVITRTQEAQSLLHWAALVGRARGEDVVVLFRGTSSGTPIAEEVTPDKATDPEGTTKAMLEVAGVVREAVAALPGAEDVELKLADFTLVKIDGRSSVVLILEQLRAREVGLLIVGRRERSGTDTAEFDLHQKLFKHAPCNTMMLRPGADLSEAAAHILVPTDGGPHDRVAFALAGDLAAASGGDVTAFYVQTEVGDDAEALGQKTLERAVERAPSRHRERIQTKVVLAKSALEGLLAEAGDYDLALLGSSDQPFVTRLLFRTVPDALLAGPEGTSVAVVRRSVALPLRLERALLYVVSRTVPQLARADRISLVERLRTSSELNFDFVFLTCLSTLIAALGLVADNVAVIIGAMLVAPLMTPLIGAGLALVQGNGVLLRRTLHTVFAGFLMALGVGAILGWITQPDMTEAMLSRAGPGPLDLTVAFASGMAAAYAIARPGLSAALPGVAIAASLVPPIAASGLGLVEGRFEVAAGAALLFFTNTVAIVLGAALSLFAAGVRSAHLHRRQRTWARRLAVATFVAAAIVLVLLSFWLHHVAR